MEVTLKYPSGGRIHVNTCPTLLFNSGVETLVETRNESEQRLPTGDDWRSADIGLDSGLLKVGLNIAHMWLRGTTVLAFELGAE